MKKVYNFATAYVIAVCLLGWHTSVATHTYGDCTCEVEDTM